MPIGMIALMAVAIAVYFGLAQRILDRMRLSDRMAIGFILAMAAGSFLDIPVYTGRIHLSVNIGGALLPFLLAVWLILKADTVKEKLRSLLAAVSVAALVYIGSVYLPYEPETMFLDPKMIYGIGSGLIAYLFGRSRRAAFAGGVLGIILSDVVHTITLFQRDLVGTTIVGGAGAFDVVIVTAFIAVLTAEFVGEFNERLSRMKQNSGKHRLGRAMMEVSEELEPKRQATVKNGTVLSLLRKKDGTAKRGDANE